MERIGDYYFKLDDKYLLGRGASSSVYLAKYRGPTKNTRLVKNSKVAIKIINTHNLTNRALSVLDEEINIMNIIKNNPHPNIVICHDIFKDTNNNRIYIIMEFCDSGDLFSILVGKPIKEHYVQFYFSQFSNGLRYLYQNKIIHRDIKPQNILLTNEKKILKIADFGFARRTHENIMYDTICGSPLYMDPKILNRECYNNQSDLWSIGLILYEMLYGFHPFKECKSIPELREEISNKEIDIPPPNKINTNQQVSSECLDLLKKLLQKNSDNRITWEQFFDIEWLKKYPDHILVQVQKPESYERKIQDMSLGSFGCKFSIPERFNNLNIIDDYLEKSIDKYIEHKQDNNKLDDLIFEFELDTPKSESPVLIKCVVDNNSVLPDQKYEIIRSKKIDISNAR